MAIETYPTSPPDEKTLAAIFSTLPDTGSPRPMAIFELLDYILLDKILNLCLRHLTLVNDTLQCGFKVAITTVSTHDINNATETFNKLNGSTYSDQVLPRAQIFLNAFLNVREIVEDEVRSGRTCTSKTEEDVEKVETLIRFDRRLTVRRIGSELNLNYQTVHDILTQSLGQFNRTPTVTLIRHSYSSIHTIEILSIIARIV
ncbi:hypothetical protein E2986_13479 [Frieseomelitta varia]|uniref:Uncharacterized protein n=1 Tax=Frieseomelitta varia TaxID=561572 RepID=A0A833S4R7_9HYME|nr:hypothetical protein E2986_13479 [Frieseomelitta varia]